MEHTFKILTPKLLQEAKEAYEAHQRELAEHAEAKKRGKKNAAAGQSADEREGISFGDVTDLSPHSIQSYGGVADMSEESDDWQPNPRLAAGNKLPPGLADCFSAKKFSGRALVEIDEYYRNQLTFVVIARDKTIFRFSASEALFFMSPFNFVRRAALYILVHPLFSAAVLIAIIANCFFMTRMSNPHDVEYTFTAIYTVEFLIKLLARGMILKPFTYLRDTWNWLDFIVIGLAYLMFIIPTLGNLSALRCLRVLRALKTVTTVPGLKTIVGALMEAVKRLRDVGILTIFVLSIFALISSQIFRGTFLQKCVLPFNESDWSHINSSTQMEEIREEWWNNQSNWHIGSDGLPRICSKNSLGQQCPAGFICNKTSYGNPNFNYTNYDNFGYAFLCSFRLMTQDYWENLYQLTIRANGTPYSLYFFFVILLGSFYLVNVILAIVAMSYDEVCKQDAADEEEDEALRQKEAERQQELADNCHISTSDISSMSLLDLFRCTLTDADVEDQISVKSSIDDSVLRRNSFRLSLRSRPKKTNSFSLPASPNLKNGKRVRSQMTADTAKAGECRPLFSLLDTISLPFADESNAETPANEDSCAIPVSPNRRLVRKQVLQAIFGNSNCATKTKLLTKISMTKSPMESHFYKQLLVGGVLIKNDEKEYEKGSGGGCGGGVANGIPDIIFENFNHKEDAAAEEIAARQQHDANGYVEINMQDVALVRTLLEDAGGGGDDQRLAVLDCLSEMQHHHDKLKKSEMIKKWLVANLWDNWTCCKFWDKYVHKWSKLFVLDPFVELFITICIVVNTTFMAVETPDNSENFKTFLKYANMFFTTTFALEGFLKLIALKPQTYFKEGWNKFDFLIVLLSLIELVIKGPGLRILRAFRLLRVFKLAKSWKTMNLLFAIIARTMGAVGNLVFVLVIVIFIFAVVGMQLFGENYKKFANKTEWPQYNGEVPRWHFMDFTHSFMIVFRVLCGEWIESMWDCMNANGFQCIPFFGFTIVIAYLVVLNLFLALLLSSFAGESLQRREEEDEVNKLQEAIDRINRFRIWLKINVKKLLFYIIQQIAKHFCPRKNEQDDCLSDDSDTPTQENKLELDLVSAFQPVRNGAFIMENIALSKKAPNHCYDVEHKSIVSPTKSNKSSQHASGAQRERMNSTSPPGLPPYESIARFDEDPEINEVEVVYWDAPEDCLPAMFERRLPNIKYFCDNSKFGKLWWELRCKAYRLVEHKYFETFIIFMIVLSSLTLTLEDANIENNDKVPLKTALDYMDKCFTIIFTFEMLMKWFAFGLKKYFKDAWCWLDFIIVNVAVVSLIMNIAGVQSNMGAFKAMRTLRAMRPLRAVSRWEGMKIVVNALIQAIPSIFNVLMVCIIFWLIFGIMGMQLFAGQFWRCESYPDGVILEPTVVNNKSDCDAMKREYNNVTWTRARINFDNILSAYLALFQVATFKGWMVIMRDAVDMRGDDLQPMRDHGTHYYFFFVLFIICGAFFTLNLFIGVIIDNFNVQKKKAGGSLEMFMTEDQKKYYKAMKKMSSTAPTKPIPKPTWCISLLCFKLINNQKFDMVVMGFIMLNTITMCIEYEDQPVYYSYVLKQVNIFFVIIFTIEFIIKLTAQRVFYFRVPWNLFDFVIVILSILSWAVEDVMHKLPMPPTIVRVIRVFRIGRVLRLVKSARGIRTLLFSLIVSLPALFNIGLLLVMVMFIYSIVGMSFFSKVRPRSGIDELFNFQTFPASMIVLFQICTSAGWDAVLDGIMNEEEPFCNPHAMHSDCGSYIIGVLYLITYLVISSIVIVNMYIAVILENFSQATEDVQQGLTQDDFDMFYEKWENYDLKAKGFIPLSQVYDFLDELEPPLQLPKPNKIYLATLQVPICKGDTIYCVDLVDALTRNFLGTNTDEEELAELKPTGKLKKSFEKIVISNTMQRQREHYAARVLTRLIRRVGRDAALRQLWRETRASAAAAAAASMCKIQCEQNENYVTNVGTQAPLDGGQIDVQATSQAVLS